MYLACGIWLSKYKSQRPEEKWESNRYRGGTAGKGQERKRTSQRPPKGKKSNGNNVPTSEANCPQSETFPLPETFLQPGLFPHQETFFPHSEAYEMPGQRTSPPRTAHTVQQDDLRVNRVEIPAERGRSASTCSSKRPNAMASDAASAALKRAIQSSPARWVGTQHSPIEVDDELGSTRRLLFPSPRKDGSPKVLGELATNGVITSTDVPPAKEQVTEASDKENRPPGFDAEDAEAELLRLFEADMSRPTTPVQKSPAPNPFKTPTRPTPSHRPITRSVSRSLRSAKSPRQLLTFSQQTPSRTPSSVNRRRSPRNHHGVFESPFTATLHQLMSETDNHKSSPRHCNFELDFNNLSDLPSMDNSGHHGGQDGMNFSLEDFFSTDVPMPSSPPRGFHLYEDPLAMTDADWNEFNEFQASPLKKGPGSERSGKGVEVKMEPGHSEESGVLTQHGEHAEEHNH